MSMTRADHVYDNHWEECLDGLKIDYKKLCDIYHKSMDEYQKEKESEISLLEENIEKDISAMKRYQEIIFEMTTEIGELSLKIQEKDFNIVRFTEQISNHDHYVKMKNIVLERYEKMLVEKDAEIERLKNKLLTFEGMIFFDKDIGVK